MEEVGFGDEGYLIYAAEFASFVATCNAWTSYVKSLMTRMKLL